ncbi:hypothetical protein BH09PLA1_BH09PLA1_09020 [soil metagenome]
MSSHAADTGRTDARAEPVADHCPFLNRRDARCGEHMSIQGLDHAFDYCFGRYQGCPVYFQMLIERRARRGEAVAGIAATANLPQPFVQQQLSGHAAVQLTIHRQALRGGVKDTVAKIEKAASAPAHANAA